jgi:hypothetical protein
MGVVSWGSLDLICFLNGVIGGVWGEVKRRAPARDARTIIGRGGGV